MADKHNNLKEKLEAGVKEHVPEGHVPEEHVVEGHMLDSTQEEMKSGRASNELWSKRAEAEQEVGRKLVSRNEARTKKTTKDKE